MRRTYWTDQNATLLFTPRLKVLWGRDGFWKIALALSFHIGQVGWRLRWYPLSSPSLHQFSYCRPRVPGWRASNNSRKYLPNTPENASQPISHISDNSLRCDAPPKSLLLLQEISYLGKIHYFIRILSESVLIQKVNNSSRLFVPQIISVLWSTRLSRLENQDRILGQLLVKGRMKCPIQPRCVEFVT